VVRGASVGCVGNGEFGGLKVVRLRAEAESADSEAAPSVVFARLPCLNAVTDAPTEPTVDLAGLIGRSTGTG
jgi:hypothetical protein